jgi:glutathione S-transferase
MKFYYHPVSSYSQKALTALHEKAVAFTPEVVDIFSDDARAAYKKINPFGKLPALVADDGRLVPESSIVIEYIDSHFTTGTRLIPADPDKARQVRFYDRIFDLYVNNSFQKIFFDGRRPENERDPVGVKNALGTLTNAYDLLDKHFAKATWAVTDFSMADCAAAPALAYSRMLVPFDKHANLGAYFGRLAERPSFKRALDEAQPYLAKLAAK